MPSAVDMSNRIRHDDEYFIPRAPWVQQSCFRTLIASQTYHMHQPRETIATNTQILLLQPLNVYEITMDVVIIAKLTLSISTCIQFSFACVEGINAHLFETQNIW